MADAFKNFTSNTDKDTEGISKAGSNLLLGIGNVIDAASMPDEAESMGHEAGEDNFDNNEKNFTKV